jgi:membrane-bound serine protease (ClpP class)
MVRWLNSPAVMAVLVMLALLGIYIEFSTPGLGLPGLVAAICFVIIVGSKYLIGLANWIEVALFMLGILLLLIEFLVLPGFGIAGFSGIICILAGLFGMLIKNPPNNPIPWPQTPFEWRTFTEGVLGLSLGFFGFVVFAWLFAKYLPKIRFLSGLILVPTATRGDEMHISFTTGRTSETRQINVGETGEVVSTLRPTGKAKFGDAIVDVVAEAEFLDKGCKVEIIEIHGNKVVVKKCSTENEEQR